MVKRAYDGLGRLPRDDQLWAAPFGLVVRPDPHTGVSPNSVERLVRTVDKLVEMFDEHPQAATAEPVFLDRVAALIAQDRVDASRRRPRPAAEETDRPGPTARGTERTRPATQETQRLETPVNGAGQARPPARETEWAGPSAREPERRVAGQRPRSREEAAPVLESPMPAPAPPPVRPRLEPVMYEGAEIVTVDERTTVQRLMRQNITDADCLDELQRDGRPVGLVHLVFVPDDGTVGRTVAKRRNAIALELDQLFSTVDRDADTGRPARLAVDVFSATTPVQKHGVLRMAGEATEAVLPKVKIEYFSVSDTLMPLLDAARRTTRALLARDVDVVSQHFVFLAALRFPADETTVKDWVGLMEHARVTWIDFGTGDRPPLTVRIPRSPFGLHVLTNMEDVLTVVKKHSEVLYQYAADHPPTAIAPPADDEPEADPPAEGRRWWPFGRRGTE
jgi:hypothetical protein